MEMTLRKIQDGRKTPASIHRKTFSPSAHRRYNEGFTLKFIEIYNR